MAEFKTVFRANKHELVAAAIEEAILGGELEVDEKLPSEQELANQFGVSRNIVREALRKIGAGGLIEVRSGAGSYVAKPTSTNMGVVLNRLVMLGDATTKDYYEIRLALEVKACELAAQRATTEDFRKLELLLENMERNATKRDEFGRLDMEFHFVIAKATKNYLLWSLLQPLKSVMTYMFEHSYSSTAKNEALQGHVRIFDALKRRDPVLAGKAMAAHLEKSEINLSTLVGNRGKPRRRVK